MLTPETDDDETVAQALDRLRKEVIALRKRVDHLADEIVQLRLRARQQGW